MGKYGFKYCGAGTTTFSAADKITHLVVHRTVKFAALTNQDDESILVQCNMTTDTEIDPFFIIHGAPGEYIKTVNITSGSVLAQPEIK
jgi:hypothetical protein